MHLLDRVSDGIHQSVMDARMLPVGPLFARFHRVIRDITRANGKDIRLVISGEKTELDKRMIDELADPMIHLIRNAADHGIESPEARVAAGKPRQGTISLDACHRGSNIVIRVSDDGQGLNHERIRVKAVEKGLISAADAERLPPSNVTSSSAPRPEHRREIDRGVGAAAWAWISSAPPSRTQRHHRDRQRARPLAPRSRSNSP